MPAPYFCTASATCMASSRVGTSTSACASKGRRSFGVTSCIMGSAKAAVLPVPVAAWPSTSRPAISAGMVSRWIGVGSS